MSKVNFSEILSDLSKKYMGDEIIEPREFILKLCECQNQPILLNEFDEIDFWENLENMTDGMASTENNPWAMDRVSATELKP